MPNALDTSGANWEKLVVTAPYLKNVDRQYQAAISFVQLYEEKIKDLHHKYMGAKKTFRMLVDASKNMKGHKLGYQQPETI